MEDKRLSIIFALIFFLLLGLIREGWAMNADKNIIYPGKGIDNIIIGNSPLGATCGKSGDIEIECGQDKKVIRIKIKSRQYYVFKSRLHVGSSISEMLRYYEKGETTIEQSKTIIKYPTQGIDFEVDKSKEQITGISIYQPRLPSFKEQYKEQFKQTK